jgi:hypothetical protein
VSAYIRLFTTIVFISLSQVMEMKNDILTGKIIGCAMKVHSVLGSGYPEVIYQRALDIEMKKQNLNFVIEKW